MAEQPRDAAGEVTPDVFDLPATRRHVQRYTAAGTDLRKAAADRDDFRDRLNWAIQERDSLAQRVRDLEAEPQA